MRHKTPEKIGVDLKKIHVAGSRDAQTEIWATGNMEGVCRKRGFISLKLNWS